MLDWAKEQIAGGAFVVSSEITSVNHPLPGWWLHGRLDITQPGSDYLIQATEPYSGRTFIARTDGGVWQPWFELATITSPKEYDLPLAAGITPLQPCKYRKNQFGEVYAYGCARSNVVDNDIVATMPEGFRPAHPIEVPASFTSNDNNRVSGTVIIQGDGRVQVHPQASSQYVIFSFNFLAWS